MGERVYDVEIDDRGSGHRGGGRRGLRHRRVQGGRPGAIERIKKSSEGGEPRAESEQKAVTAPANTPWDGLVHISKAQQLTIGLLKVQAKPQDEPIRLELYGTTAYDETTFVKIRSRFDTSVQKVYVSTGQQVHKGDPLLELFSVDLLKAKNEYKSNFIKWTAAKRLYDKRMELHKTGAISDLVWIETQNDEAGKKLELEASEQTLLVYQISPKEVASLVVGLDPNNPGTLKDEPGVLAVMTLLAGRRLHHQQGRRAIAVLSGHRRPDDDRPAGPPLRLGQRVRERPGQGRRRPALGGLLPVPRPQGQGDRRVRLQPG